MTDTTGDIYYSGQICRGSVALGTGCGKCEKCKAEAEVKEEQLYICYKASECKRLVCEHRTPHKHIRGTCSLKCGFTEEEPQCIPYTEEKEPGKSCETCRQYQVNGGLCVVDSNCKENDYLYHTSIKKEEKEPKTKRVWDPDDSISELIHYPECWDTMAYPTLASALWEMCDLTGAICPTCKKPQGEPETVEQVLERMPDIEKKYGKVWDPDDREQISEEILNYYYDLKAAQEREDNK